MDPKSRKSSRLKSKDSKVPPSDYAQTETEEDTARDSSQKTPENCKKDSIAKSTRTVKSTSDITPTTKARPPKAKSSHIDPSLKKTGKAFPKGLSKPASQSTRSTTVSAKVVPKLSETIVFRTLELKGGEKRLKAKRQYFKVGYTETDEVEIKFCSFTKAITDRRDSRKTMIEARDRMREEGYTAMWLDSFQ